MITKSGRDGAGGPLIRTLAGIVVLVAGVSFVVLHHSVDTSAGFQAFARHRDWGRITLLSAAMIAGIFFGHLHSAFSRTTGPVTVDVLFSTLRGGAFWAALMASPLVFVTVYSVAASGELDPVIAAVFAFENGFFCERILERRAK
jgi:hypothetical protein